MPDLLALNAQMIRIERHIDSLLKRVKEMQTWEQINEALLAGAEITIPDVWDGDHDGWTPNPVGKSLIVIGVDRNLFYEENSCHHSVRPDDGAWGRMLPLLLQQIK